MPKRKRTLSKRRKTKPKKKKSKTKRKVYRRRYYRARRSIYPFGLNQYTYKVPKVYGPARRPFGPELPPGYEEQKQREYDEYIISKGQDIMDTSSDSKRKGDMTDYFRQVKRRG